MTVHELDIEEALRRARTLQDLEKYEEAYAIVAPLLDHDVPEALTLAGTLLYTGMGVPADGVRAVALLRRAVNLGDGLAAHNLGTLFGTGAYGVDPDPEQAAYYYEAARQLGCDLFSEK